MADLPSLVIVGAGGLGREVAALVEAINARQPTWNLLGFVDDAEKLQETSMLGHPVRGDVNWLRDQTSLYFVIAIGDGETRRAIANRLDETAVQPATLIHPSVSVHHTVDIGAGSIICQAVSLTVNIHIDTHVILNLQCTVGHDSALNSFVTLHPGAHISGAVHLETGVSMGTGSVVLPETRIGAHSTVGAGGVVTKDLPANCTAVGVPARP